MSIAVSSDTVPKPLQALIEEARLATLDRYRQIAPSDLAGLSCVAREAAESFGATQAAVSFVDRRHVWFGGAYGFGRDEAARDGSLCDEVVRGGVPLLVSDASADPRFRAHDLVHHTPGLRSYAGVPLIEGGGYTLGTVALFSTLPGRFGAAVLPSMVALATVVRDFLTELQRRRPGVVDGAASARRIQGWLGVKTVGGGQTGTDAGLLLVGIARRSPAEAAGLRPTDIIHSIGGQTLSASSDVAAAMADQAEGSVLPIRFRRSGEWHECQVEVRARRRPVRERR